jgi:hypothetical protein
MYVELRLINDVLIGGFGTVTVKVNGNPRSL